MDKNKHRTIRPSSSAGYMPNRGNWVMCDICGFRIRASQARRQATGPHNGLLVCEADWDPHNPQWDQVESVAEKMVPDVVNPEPADNVLTAGDDDYSKITGDDL